MKCTESICFQSLPATLTKLKVSLTGQCLDYLVDLERAEQPTFLSTHFPHLTAFKFNMPYSTPFHRTELLVHVSVFLIKHAGTLRSLKLPVYEPLHQDLSLSLLILAFCRLKSLTNLHTLELPRLDDAGELPNALKSMPNLRTLYLSIEDGPSLFDVPRELLTPLKRVSLFRIRTFTPEQAEYLAALPNLREVRGEMRAYPKGIKHTNSAMTLRKNVHWATLRQYPFLESLSLNQVRSDITPLPFPRLRSVQVNVAAPLSFHLELLRVCRGVRRFTVCLDSTDKRQVSADIAALWIEAARTDVRSLEVHINCEFDERAMVPPAAPFGWMELVVRYGRSEHYCNMLWN